MDWICITGQIKAWKTDPTAQILHFTDQSGGTATDIAASILGSLLNQTYDRDVVCLSFQFDGNNILTLNNFAFYSSLCRQLLSCRPRLFEHVYFAANLLVKNENCTAKALQAILRCMLANLIDTEKVSVYCVINAVGECVAPPADVTEFMSELVKLGYGRFKLILSGKTSPMSALKSTNDWHFDLKPNSVSGVAFKKRYVQETVRTLTTDISAGNELKHLVTRHLELLWDDSFFLTAKLNMMLTLRQSKQNTRQMLETKPCPLPTTPENFYKYIISVMDGDCYMAKRALFWIANVVRPLSSTELAVAVAFEKASWNDESLDRIEDLISENSVDDLTWHTKILITRKNNRIYLIHDTLREFMHEPSTHKAWQTEDFRLGRGNHSEGRKIIRSDTHFEILFQCLEHLKNFGEQALESMRRTRGARHSLPTAEKYSFLRYACFHWPQHCQKARPVKEAQYYVSTFLEDDKMVGVWSKLYLLLSPPTKNRIEVLDDRFKIACKFGLLDLFKHFMDKLKPEEARLRMREPLNIAARNGHDTIVKMLIEHDINSPEAVGLAAAGGFQNIVEQLLSEGSDIDAPDKTGYTPLHHATYGGHIGLVDLLLASGADPNVLTSPPPSYASVSLETTEKKYTQGERQYDFLSGSSFELDTFGMELHPSRPETSNPFLHPPGKETSLHLAALTGQVEIARLLLDFGADVNANDSGYDPLKYAAEGGFPEMLTLLLDRKADPDTAAKLDGNTALHLASTRGHVKAVEILLRHSHNSFKLTRTVNGKGLSPMHIVARDGNLKLWNLMGLVKKNESDYQSTLPLQSSGRGISKSALEWAAENGHFEIVEELLKKNYWERQPRNETGAVVLAASHGHTRIITVLLNNYLSHPESESRMAIALHLAARGGHLKTLELLLGHPRGLRSQINVQEANKLTPLHIAVHQGHSNVIYLLLKSGADMDIQDKRGRTPLHIAADNGYLQCVQMLLGLGRRGDWRIRDPLERRAMYCAERFGHLPIVERVCSRSMAILWDEDKDHLTAFDLVVGRNSIQKVEAFVQILHDTEDHGSEFERRGTPLHVACQKQNMELFHFIREKGWSCKKRDSDGRTVLHRAVLHDFTQGVEFLLENEPNHVFAKDESNRTVLHYARTPQMARNLLEAGAEIDPMDSEGHTPLFMAASRGDVGVVGFLLNSTPKPDVHAQDCLGQNMLHAGFEHLPVLELMLEHKVNPNVFASNGTPLALTTDSNFLDNAKLLIEAGAQPNMWTRFENSPLYLACQSAENSLGLIKLLISNGADLLAHDDYGITALHVAVRNEKAPEALYLSKMLENMEAIEIKDIFGSALYECVWWRHFDPNLAEVFMNRGIDVNKVIEWNFTALHAACFGGSIEAVQWLVANEANVDSLLGNSATPLCAAVESERDAKEKVQLLLEKGAKINYYEPEQPSALQIALENADLELIDLLLDNKADPNLRGGHRHTPLNYAILEEFGMEIITKMVKKGADVSQPGYHDQSPVHAAAMVDRIDVLEFLTKVGIDPLAEGPQGRSALAYAVAYCCFDAVNYILANKTINVSEVDGKGQTPLIIAVVQEDTEMVKLLLESGFDEPTILDTQDYRGKTALGYAVSGNNLEIVEELLGYGADPTVTDCRGCGLLYYALREGGVEMFDTIRGALEMHGPLNIEDWNDAVHAAVASFKWTTVEAFIKDEMTQLDYGGPDGWSPLYAAEIYGNIEAKMALGGAGAEFQQSSSDLEKPSRWHSKDRFPGLQLDSNGTTLRTIGKFHKAQFRRFYDANVLKLKAIVNF